MPTKFISEVEKEGKAILWLSCLKAGPFRKRGFNIFLYKNTRRHTKSPNYNLRSVVEFLYQWIYALFRLAPSCPADFHSRPTPSRPCVVHSAYKLLFSPHKICTLSTARFNRYWKLFKRVFCALFYSKIDFNIVCPKSTYLADWRQHLAQSSGRPPGTSVKTLFI